MAVGVVVGPRRATDSVSGLVPGDIALLAATVGVALSAAFALTPERLLGASHGGRLRAVGAAPVVTWVATGLTGYCGPTAVVDAGATPRVGRPLAAVGGGLPGVVPGCGVHVGVVTGYTEGAVPASALVVNAISQDGGAVFALFAVNRGAAVTATVYTALSAVAVWLVVWAI